MIFSATAVSGVATVGVAVRPVFRFTCVPGTASGTGSVTFKPTPSTYNDTGYEPVYDREGAVLTINLSSQFSMDVQGSAGVAGLKVTSDNSGDTFTLIVDG